MNLMAIKPDVVLRDMAHLLLTPNLRTFSGRRNALRSPQSLKFPLTLNTPPLELICRVYKVISKHAYAVDHFQFQVLSQITVVHAGRQRSVSPVLWRRQRRNGL